MSLENSIEVTAESVEAAIRKGLEALSAAPYEVIVEVLDEPSEAYFGGEARPARVRLKRLTMPKPPLDMAAFSAQSAQSAQAQVVPLQIPRSEDRPLDTLTAAPAPRTGEQPARSRRDAKGGGRDRRDRRRGERSGKPERREEPGFSNLPDSAFGDVADYGVNDDEVPIFVETELIPDEQHDDEAQIGRVVLETLLEKMGLPGVQIEVRRSPAAAVDEPSPWVLNLIGMRIGGRLVGKRGETLAALQYLARLIASRELQRRAEFIVDVDNYKAKRASSLRVLALRLADDAVQKRRVVSMEPMPPHERRIVHMALRERADVTTRSVGEGRNRKVTIVPDDVE
jgi:spoIIIJ-associated protein